MFSSIGFSEILLVLAITLVVIGPEKLPDVARKLGKGLREVRRATNMFRDMLLLDETPDYRRQELASERVSAQRALDEPPPSVAGTLAHDGPARPPVRPVLLSVARRATHTTDVALSAGAPSDACTFEELTAPRG